MLSKKLTEIVNTNLVPEGDTTYPCVIQIAKRGEEFTVFVNGIGGHYDHTLGVGKSVKKALKRAIKNTKIILKEKENILTSSRPEDKPGKYNDGIKVEPFEEE